MRDNISRLIPSMECSNYFKTKSGIVKPLWIDKLLHRHITHLGCNVDNIKRDFCQYPSGQKVHLPSGKLKTVDFCVNSWHMSQTLNVLYKYLIIFKFKIVWLIWQVTCGASMVNIKISNVCFHSVVFTKFIKMKNSKQKYLNLIES